MNWRADCTSGQSQPTGGATMKTNEPMSLDDTFLATVTGGDFAHDYAARLRKDTDDMYNRRVAAGNALKKGDWGGAAKNAVAYGANALHGVFDLVNFS